MLSSVLAREEDDGTQRYVHYTSKVMVDREKRYHLLEKLVLPLVIFARRLKPYF